MWREAVEIVVKMWEQERFSWDSDLLQMPERMQTPKPFQDPHPPCWLAAAGEASAANVGRNGVGLLSFALLQPVEAMAKHIQIYRNAQAEGHPPLTRIKNDRVGAYTLVHCTDDMEAAAGYGLWDSVRWWYQHLAEFTLTLGAAQPQPRRADAVFPLLKPSIEGDIDIQRYTDEDMIIVGTPDECVEKILRYEEAGVDQLLCYVQFGTLPHDKVMRNLELLGSKVIPRARAAWSSRRLQGTVRKVARARAAHGGAGRAMDLISSLRYAAQKKKEEEEAAAAAAAAEDAAASTAAEAPSATEPPPARRQSEHRARIAPLSWAIRRVSSVGRATTL